MSVGSKLNEMENIEENVVTKGAKPAEPMQKLSTGGTPATWEDLGGPTPENYKTDDDSAKLKTPSLAQVKNVVNKGAKSAEPIKSTPKDYVKSDVEVEVKDDQEVVAEEPTKEETTVSEEEVKEEPTVNVEEDLAALFVGDELSEE